MEMAKANRYSVLIEAIFFKKYKSDKTTFKFEREDINKTATELQIELPKNIGDVIYSFRFRNPLPEAILETAPEGFEWLIKLAGKAQYKFCLEKELIIAPNKSLAFSKLLDSTPGVIQKYSLSDEQALLAILRYNRLIDTFLGLTCYSLQNHLRTTIPSMGQVETDEIYIGVDKRGAQYIIPVQAKGGNDKQGKVQIEQDIELCKHKFPNLINIPIAAQFMSDGKIALFSFDEDKDNIVITSEHHYKLVDSSELSNDEISKYRLRK